MIISFRGSNINVPDGVETELIPGSGFFVIGYNMPGGEDAYLRKQNQTIAKLVEKILEIGTIEDFEAALNDEPILS